MKNDVFISYVTPNLEFAENLLEFLKNEKFNCFFAPRNMIGGQEFAGELVRAVKNSRTLLFIHSKYANVHDINVLAEIRAARDNNIPIILVKLDGTEFNDDFTYYLSGLHAISYTPNNFEQCARDVNLALDHLLPKDYPVEEEVKPVTEFLYIPKYGMMINPADNERNVSFRTKTFINMMAGIYERVAKLSGEEAAQEIFFQSGYDSGKNFADRINAQWGHSFSAGEMLEKIRKWCEFDSAVGWGKFEADIQFDENGEIPGGTMTITAPFIVDRHCECKVCAFIHGYCSGVLDTILNEMDVELECCSCPLVVKSLVPKCTFKVKMKGE